MLIKFFSTSKQLSNISVDDKWCQGRYEWNLCVTIMCVMLTRYVWLPWKMFLNFQWKKGYQRDPSVCCVEHEGYRILFSASQGWGIVGTFAWSFHCVSSLIYGTIQFCWEEPHVIVLLSCWLLGIQGIVQNDLQRSCWWELWRVKLFLRMIMLKSVACLSARPRCTPCVVPLIGRSHHCYIPDVERTVLFKQGLIDIEEFEDIVWCKTFCSRSRCQLWLA
jgi:hypothetical protein